MCYVPCILSLERYFHKEIGVYSRPKSSKHIQAKGIIHLGEQKGRYPCANVGDKDHGYYRDERH